MIKPYGIVKKVLYYKKNETSIKLKINRHNTYHGRKNWNDKECLNEL